MVTGPTMWKNWPELIALVVLIIGFIIAISSGFINFYFPSFGGGGIQLPGMSEELVTTLGVFLMLLLSVVAIVKFS